MFNWQSGWFLKDHNDAAFWPHQSNDGQSEPQITQITQMKEEQLMVDQNLLPVLPEHLKALLTRINTTNISLDISYNHFRHETNPDIQYVELVNNTDWAVEGWYKPSMTHPWEVKKLLNAYAKLCKRGAFTYIEQGLYLYLQPSEIVSQVKAVNVGFITGNYSGELEIPVPEQHDYVAKVSYVGGKWTTSELHVGRLLRTRRAHRKGANAIDDAAKKLGELTPAQAKQFTEAKQAKIAQAGYTNKQLEEVDLYRSMDVLLSGQNVLLTLHVKYETVGHFATMLANNFQYVDKKERVDANTGEVFTPANHRDHVNAAISTSFQSLVTEPIAPNTFIPYLNDARIVKFTDIKVGTRVKFYLNGNVILASGGTPKVIVANDGLKNIVPALRNVLATNGMEIEIF